jgi:predicted GNAT family acetyltransferase
MAKGKLGRIMFRKIGGRIVPIKILNLPNPKESNNFVKIRNIVAKSDEFGQMGKLTLSIPKKGKSATIDNVMVDKEFRRKGISKNLFKRATDFLERTNKKFLHSTDMQHHAQASIRWKYGSYKAGGKRKNRTKFFADQFGPYGEHTRKVSVRDAIEYIKQNKSPNSNGRLITATTMIKRRKK